MTSMDSSVKLSLRRAHSPFAVTIPRVSWHTTRVHTTPANLSSRLCGIVLVHFLFGSTERILWSASCVEEDFFHFLSLFIMSSCSRTSPPHSVDCFSTQESWLSQRSSLPTDEDLTRPNEPPDDLSCANDAQQRLDYEAHASISADQFIALHWSWSCSPNLSDLHARVENPSNGCHYAPDGTSTIELNKSSVQLYLPPEPSFSFDDRLNEAYSNGTLLTYFWSLVSQPLSVDVDSPALVQPQFQPRDFLIPLGPFPANEQHMQTQRRLKTPSKRLCMVDIITNDMTVNVYRPSLVCSIVDDFQHAYAFFAQVSVASQWLYHHITKSHFSFLNVSVTTGTERRNPSTSHHSCVYQVSYRENRSSAACSSF